MELCQGIDRVYRLLMNELENRNNGIIDSIDKDISDGEVTPSHFHRDGKLIIYWLSE